MNDTEKEVLVLNSFLEATSDLLSINLIAPYANPQGIVTEVKPKDNLEKRLFAIIYLELISHLDTTLFKGKQRTAIDFLVEIGLDPKLGGKRLGKKIAVAAGSFNDWLNQEFDYDFDSTLGKRIVVKFTRKEVINFCGNFQKHFSFRLGKVGQKMAEIYAKVGIQVTGLGSLKLLEDVQTWLYDDVFAYHFTKMCEHVSAVNNAVENYLFEIYTKRYEDIDGTFYKYAMPRVIKDDFGKSQFYDLLNKIRSRHRRPRMVIETSEWLEKRY